MRPIRVVLIDDERIGRARLRRMLDREPDFQVVAECSDGPSGLDAVRQARPDLLFLDVNMPGMNGFEMLDRLAPEEPPAIIFVTAFDEHAVRAFEACALDYLLKPVSPERLAKTLDRARALLTPAESAATKAPPPENAAPLPDPAATSSPARFVVRSGARVSFVMVETIDWIEAAGNYAIFHVGPHNHMVRETMSGLEAQLPAEHFLRVSRSVILNLRRVKELYDAPAGTPAAILEDGQRIPITRSLREVADRLSTL